MKFVRYLFLILIVAVSMLYIGTFKSDFFGVTTDITYWIYNNTTKILRPVSTIVTSTKEVFLWNATATTTASRFEIHDNTSIVGDLDIFGTLAIDSNKGTLGQILMSSGTTNSPVWISTSSLGLTAVVDTSTLGLVYTDIGGLGTMAVETATDYLTVATAGTTYLTIATTTNFVRWDAASTTLWDTAYSWGDWSGEGFLTSVASDADWTVHGSYPAACAGNEVVRGIGDTLTCVATSTLVGTLGTMAYESADNYFANTLLNAKGDLISATANDTPSILTVGTNGKVLMASSSAATGLDWVTTSSLGISGGSGTPVGNDGNVQYNNGGSFGGSDSLFWDDTNNRLGIASTTPNAQLSIEGSITQPAFRYSYGHKFNQVLDYAPSTYTDLNPDASASFGTVSGAVCATVNDYLYVGLSTTFSGIYIDVGTNKTTAGTSLAVMYSTSTDPDLFATTTDGVVDGTSAFYRDGVITFTPPADWTTTTVNSIENLYWVRLRLSNGTSPDPTVYLVVPASTNAPFSIYANSGDDRPAFVVSQNGSVIIGTTTTAIADTLISRFYVYGQMNVEGNAYFEGSLDAYSIDMTGDLTGTGSTIMNIASTATSSAGRSIQNNVSTAATAGFPEKWSPSFAQVGRVWNTTFAQSHLISWLQRVAPTSGANPTAALLFSFNNATSSVKAHYNETGTEIVRFDSRGFVNINSSTASAATLTVQGTTTLNIANFASSTGVSAFFIGENGKVGINTTTPSTTLSVDGTILQTAVRSCANGLTSDANGAITGCAVSDERLKSEIEDVGDIFGKFMGLKTKTYKITDSRFAPGEKYGLIAQDVEKIFPELVSSFYANDEEFKNIDYDGMTAILVDIVQKQQEQINELEQRISDFDGKPMGAHQVSWFIRFIQWIKNLCHSTPR